MGWRLEGQFASGDIPFYSKPFISLRCIPAMRYQGDDVLLTELEVRWNINKRWSAIGFTGVGRAEDELNDLINGEGENRFTVGFGGRYLIARKVGLYAGFDIAKGPDETVFYLQVGSAWQ